MEIGNMNDIRKRVMETANELKVPLNKNDLNIRRVKKIIKINAKWTDTVEFWGFYRMDIDFDAGVEY